VALADGSISVCHWLASVFEVGQVGITIDYREGIIVVERIAGVVVFEVCLS
jgi:hypothetical protein